VSEGHEMNQPLSCQILPLVPFAEAAGYARLAEELGYDSVLCSHIAARDSFTVLAALAMHTKHIHLGTAVAPIYHRSPASMAQTAATLVVFESPHRVLKALADIVASLGPERPIAVARSNRKSIGRFCRSVDNTTQRPVIGSFLSSGIQGSKVPRFKVRFFELLNLELGNLELFVG